jgi:hypothetical protein
MDECPIIPNVLTCAVVTLLVTLAGAAATDRRSYTLPLPSGRAISVELTIGTLRVQGESRTDALIEVVRTAPTAEALGAIPVTIDEADTAVRIVGTQAAAGTDPSLRTDVTLRVPRDARLDSLRVMEGRITLASLVESVTADVRRGPIEATRLEGIVRLETGIGDVTATEMRLSPQGLLRLRAFNGDVRLALAERPPNARVMALALNGSIQSDLPLKMRDTWGPRWGEATLGTGEPVISLDTVTGAIELKLKTKN